MVIITTTTIIIIVIVIITIIIIAVIIVIIVVNIILIGVTVLSAVQVEAWRISGVRGLSLARCMQISGLDERLSLCWF